MDTRSSDLHGEIVIHFQKEVMSKKEKKKIQRRKSEVKPSKIEMEDGEESGKRVTSYSLPCVVGWIIVTFTRLEETNKIVCLRRNTNFSGADG